MTAARLDPQRLPDADGVIVGSAIAHLVERHRKSSTLVSEIGDFIAALEAPLRAAGCP